MSKVEKNPIKIDKTEIAISVKGVSKTFRIPHEKISSVKGAVLSAFKSKSYEEFKALDDVSFEVKKGEFFGIIGRNGSGKSTLLKVLAGIYQADKGKVEVNGMISPFLELGIGFNPELSGRDNVYLNATVLGMTKKQIDEKFDSIVKFSELERFIDQKLKNYSSGMSVRLAFSVSIHANRDILLMDEVLAVGDSNFQSKCLTEFSKYKKNGKTVILVTHDIGTVQYYCDRAMLIRNGKIIKIGETNEVTNKYIEGNIIDEEERFSDASKMARISIKKKKSESKKIAEITDVKFLDRSGKIKNIFETGEFLRIKVFFEINNKIDRPIIGFSIINNLGVIITGTNNRKRNFNIGTLSCGNAGYICYDFSSIDLLGGEYKINVAIAEDNGRIYDQVCDKYYISINSQKFQEYGIINLKPAIFVEIKK